MASCAGLLCSRCRMLGAPRRADDAGQRDIPAAFAPFEYLIGRWNGQGIPKDNPAQKFRGWPETHTWAWKFAKGKPVGLTVDDRGRQDPDVRHADL